MTAYEELLEFGGERIFDFLKMLVFMSHNLSILNLMKYAIKKCI